MRLSAISVSPTSDLRSSSQPLSHCKCFGRIGTEHEKLGYFKDSKRRMTYKAIEHLLWGLCQKYKWKPIMEGEFIIGSEKDGQSVTIEPGGQFELSGAPVNSLHDTLAEVSQHIEQVITDSAKDAICFQPKVGSCCSLPATF